MPVQDTAFEGAARISVNQLGHRFGGALSLSDEFAVVGLALPTLLRGCQYAKRDYIRNIFTRQSNFNATYNVTTSVTHQIPTYNYSEVPDRGAGFVFAIVPDPPTAVTGIVSNEGYWPTIPRTCKHQCIPSLGLSRS